MPDITKLKRFLRYSMSEQGSEWLYAESANDMGALIRTLLRLLPPRKAEKDNKQGVPQRPDDRGNMAVVRHFEGGKTYQEEDQSVDKQSRKDKPCDVFVYPIGGCPNDVPEEPNRIARFFPECHMNVARIVGKPNKRVKQLSK
jgi:hypothetical protein